MKRLALLSLGFLTACASTWRPDNLNVKGNSVAVDDGITTEAEEEEIKRDIVESLAQTDVLLAKEEKRAPLAILTDHLKTNGRSIMPETREIFGYAAERRVKITYVFSDRRLWDKKEYLCVKDLPQENPVFVCKKIGR